MTRSSVPWPYRRRSSRWSAAVRAGELGRVDLRVDDDRRLLLGRPRVEVRDRGRAGLAALVRECRSTRRCTAGEVGRPGARASPSAPRRVEALELDARGSADAKSNTLTGVRELWTTAPSSRSSRHDLPDQPLARRHAAAAEERLAEYARTWASAGSAPGARAGGRCRRRSATRSARILGAPPGSTVMHQNVAIAEAIVLSCFRPVDPRRNRSSTSARTSRRVRYLYQAQPDLEVVVCEDVEEILERDRRAHAARPDQPRPVQPAEIQDVERDRPARARGRRARGARLLPVGGHRPVRPDGARRRLRRRRLGEVALRRAGNGWLYVRPDLVERLEPTLAAGRRTRARSRSSRSCEYAPGDARFLTGTPNVPALYAATAGYDLIEEVGVDASARARSGRRAPDRARRRGRVRGALAAGARAPRRHGHHRTSRTSRPCTRSSRARQIICDFRPGAGIRLGPHFFTTDDELGFAIAQIADILETGAYRRHEGAVAVH